MVAFHFMFIMLVFSSLDLFAPNLQRVCGTCYKVRLSFRQKVYQRPFKLRIVGDVAVPGLFNRD